MKVNNLSTKVEFREPLKVYQSYRLPALVNKYPQLRIMGNKYRLLPWIGSIFNKINFKTALDAFSGSGSIGYLLKCMGKQVTSNDFLNFSYHIANALIANNDFTISKSELNKLLSTNPNRKHFISNTFNGIFFNKKDNDFLDNVWANLQMIRNPYKKSLVIAALCRASIKKQPRGVFSTATPKNVKYNDGRRDLRLEMRDHFIESVFLFNILIFNNDQKNSSMHTDIFDFDLSHYDLIYFDPPYVPQRDDNCYIKRYHFLEGLSCYWKDQEILEKSVVKKIKKKYTPFSYRHQSIKAFQELFDRSKNSIIILSYSSNGFPDKDTLKKLLESVKGKDNVQVEVEDHTYHFGTHHKVTNKRKYVQEYLFIGS